MTNSYLYTVSIAALAAMLCGVVPSPTGADDWPLFSVAIDAIRPLPFGRAGRT
jgi:hypothetical protein